MTEKQRRERADFVLKTLNEKYPSAECALEYDGDAWRLLVMGRLSAQCTDKRVNIVCKDLFEKFPDVYSMAAAPVEEIEKIVYPCGVYRVKAQNIKDFSQIIIDSFGGKVPDNMDDLLTLPGVGRKIANLILGDVYHKPAVVTDTHCIRISNRLGLAQSKDPVKVEKALKNLIPDDEQSDFCHRLVRFGREVCDARSPKCSECPFEQLGCAK